MYEKSASVTFGGMVLDPNGDSRWPLPPKKDRPQPLIENAAVMSRRTTLPARAVGGTLSRWVRVEGGRCA